MDKSHDLRELGVQIRQDPCRILSHWMEALSSQSLRLGAALSRLELGKDPDESAPEEQRGDRPSSALLLRRCEYFLTVLADSLGTAEKLELGSPLFREPLQVISFTGGWMAGVGLGISDAVGLIHSLQAALGSGPRRLFQGLEVAITEAFTAAMAQQAHVRYRDAMEKVQLVCDLGHGRPCLFLVGEPDQRALDDAIGRLMTLVVMLQAPAAILDGSGLFSAAQVLPGAVQILLDYNKMTRVALVLSGVEAKLGRQLEDEAEGLSAYEDLSRALEAMG